MSLKKSAVSGVLWTGTQQFSTQIISFVESVILARLLLPKEFGLLAMIGVFLAIGKSLADAGLTSSLIRTKDPDQDDYSTVFFFNLAGSILLYGLLFLSSPYIADFYDEPQLTAITRWYGIVFVINAFGAIQFTRLTKTMNFKTQMIISIPSILIGGIVGIVMALMGYGVWSLVFGNIAQALAKSTQLWFYSKWSPSFRFHYEKFRYHFGYGYKLTLSGLLSTIFNNGYTIIIGKVFNPAIVGFYNRAENLKQLPVYNIGSILNKVTFPLFAKIQDDDERLRRVYKRIMSMVIFVLAPVLIFMAVLAVPLFRFVYTEKWLPAVPYFQILCANGILYPIHAYNLNVLKVKGRSDLFLKLEIYRKIIFVIVVAITIQWGIYGLLYGSVLLSVLSFFINTHYTGKFINFTAWQQTKALIPYILSAVAAGAAVYGVDILLENLHDLLRILIGSFLGIILYLGINYVLKFGAMRDLIQLVLRRKKKSTE